MSTRTPFIAGNWKMNKTIAEAEAFIAALLPQVYDTEGVDVAICPPYLALQAMVDSTRGSRVGVYAQNMHFKDSGAYTGEVSAAMLAEFGCRYAIVGHSERRQYHHETDQIVADKAKAALAKGLTPIVCVGESLAQRETGETDAVVKRQLSAVIHTLAHCAGEMVVAYEPVWAIGTGRTATPEQAQAVHALLRAQMHAATPHADQMKILYGGSVKADNAAALFAQPDIDGGLIGGASLKASDFIAICRAAG